MDVTVSLFNSKKCSNFSICAAEVSTLVRNVKMILASTPLEKSKIMKLAFRILRLYTFHKEIFGKQRWTEINMKVQNCNKTVERVS